MPASLPAHFAARTDPRAERGRNHPVLTVLTIALCAVIGGADSWVEVVQFGKAKREWFAGFLDLSHGIPSHDTFGNVFAALDPDQFHACFLAWVQAAVTQTAGAVIAVDGKTARRSHDRGAGKAAIHTVSAWASANGIVPGQVKTDAKSNGITAIPALLDLLDLLLLKGGIVTIDAMGCQTAIARQIVTQGGDSVLALKENQSDLYHGAGHLFTDGRATDFADYQWDAVETVAGEHGRVEVRRCWTISDAETLMHLNGEGEWIGLRAVAMVEAEQRVGNTVVREQRYHLTSMTEASVVERAVREHWGIENGLHWVSDVAFRENECRVRVRAPLSRWYGTWRSTCSRESAPPRSGWERSGSKRGGMRSTCALCSLPDMRLPWRQGRRTHSQGRRRRCVASWGTSSGFQCASDKEMVRPSATERYAAWITSSTRRPSRTP